MDGEKTIVDEMNFIYYFSLPFRFLRAWWRSVKRSVFPMEAIEPVIFILFFSVYFFLGKFTLEHSNILTDLKSSSGTYLGYDNIYQLYSNGGDFNPQNPLFNFFHFVKWSITSIVEHFWGTDIRAISCIIVMNFFVSSGLVCIFRYLRRIAALPKRRAFLLTLNAASCFTTIILSFTVGTFPFSFFFLILSLLVLSTEYMNKGRFNSYTTAVFSFILGGINLNNLFKPLLIHSIFSGNLKEKLKSLLSGTVPLFVCSMLLLGIYSVKNTFSDSKPLKNNYESSANFIKNKHEEEQKYIIMNSFMSNTIMSTPLVPQWADGEKELRPTKYLMGWQYAVPILLFLLCVSSIFLNIRNPYVWFLSLYFSIDIIIHLVLGINIGNAPAFGGHWLFLIPMYIGWIYNKIPIRAYRAIDITMLLITICMITFNTLELYRIADKYLNIF